MSIPALSAVGGLPAAAAASAPAPATASAAAGGAPTPVDPKIASAAKAFERVLLEQLTKQLASSAAPEDGSDGASAATKAYRDMLPNAMADALSQSGGIGIAAQLQESMTRAAVGTATDVTAAAAAPDAAATAATATASTAGISA